MKKHILIAVVAVFAGSSAFANQPEGNKRKDKIKAQFDAMDFDKDGRVSFAEAKKANNKKVMAKFGLIDSDPKDGHITLAELKAFKKRKK